MAQQKNSKSRKADHKAESLKCQGKKVHRALRHNGPKGSNALASYYREMKALGNKKGVEFPPEAKEA